MTADNLIQYFWVGQERAISEKILPRKVEAIKRLVSVAEQKLKLYPPKGDKNEAFYIIERRNVVVEISHRRSRLKAESMPHLVIELNVLEGPTLGEAIKITTVSDARRVSNNEANSLGEYTPDQLKLLRMLIAEGHPLSKKHYDAKISAMEARIQKKNEAWPFSGNA